MDQHRESLLWLLLQREERPEDPNDLDSPLQDRLDGGGTSSSSSSSLKLHSMEGNDMLSSKAFETSWNSDISNEVSATVVRDRFSVPALIIGRSDEIT